MFIKNETLEKLHSPIRALPEIIVFAINLFDGEDVTIESDKWVVAVERSKTHLFANVFDRQCFDADGEYALAFYEEEECEGVYSVSTGAKLAIKLLKHCKLEDF